ncbi:MAG: sensor histidine kinase [Paraglaciecola sp.]|nr:sensor histidine kinase [Paraglaciecola sp.]
MTLHKHLIEISLYVFAWLVVIGVSIVLWHNGEYPNLPPLSVATLLPALAWYGLFLVALLSCRRTLLKRKVTQRQRHHQLFCLIICLFSFTVLVDYFFFMTVGILLVLTLAQFAPVLRPSYAWSLAIIGPAVFATAEYFITCSFSLETKLLYMVFNCLVLLFSYSMLSERQEVEKSNQLIRELQATQTLLSAASRREERLRISRDLHDALGHKLTALKLQLEIATNIENGQHSTNIQQAKAISDLLLSDVRQAVSDFRHDSAIELGEALQSLTHHLPGLMVDLQVDLDETQLSARQAEVLFRCAQESITNIMRHSNADHCTLKLQQCGDDIVHTVTDNGKQVNPINAGNGLTGMAERVSKLDGKLHYAMSQLGFSLNVVIPADLA